jgi:serine/threonine protein kinase
LSKNIPSENPTLSDPKKKSYGSFTDISSSSIHTSVLPETSNFRGEYLPEPSQITSPIEAVSCLSPDQIQALPFSFRRRVKSVLSGTATENDLKTVGDNIDTILELSGSVSSKDSTPVSTTPAMAIGHKRIVNLQRDSPTISPNTSTFFNYSQPEPLLSPSSQSYLRQQNADALSFSASSNRKLHRAATMYPAVSGRKLGSLSSRHNSVSASNLRGNISRSASLSSANDSPALQFLTRIANNTFSPIAATNSEGEDMGEQIGNYVIGKMIGYGGFSAVKEAHTIDENGAKETKAVKIVRKIPQNVPFRNPDIVGDDDDRMERLHEMFDHEVLLWKTLDHPNVLKLLCVHDNDHATYCFTDKITGGTLFDLIKLSKRKGLPTAECIDFAKQLAAALLYLHETQKIVHRDVKPENCLIEIEKDEKKRLVICDFGMSDYFGIESNDGEDTDMEGIDDDGQEVPYYAQKIGPSSTSSILNQYHRKKSETSSGVSSTKPSRQNSLLTSGNNNSGQFSGISSSVSSLSFTTDNNIGSLPYASPELLLSPTPIFDPTIDIWAYGVLVYFMFKGSLPWQHPLAPKLREMILKGDWQPSEFEAHVFQKLLNESGNTDGHDRLKIIAERITNLVRNCLQIDPEKRFTIRQIVEYDWGV